MTHDPLGQLLSRADAAAAPNGVTTIGLAERVRTELRRRRTRTMRTVGLSMLLLAAVTAIPIARSLLRPPAKPAVEIAAVPQRGDHFRDEVTALRIQTAAREAAVAAMLRSEARVRRSSSRPAPDPLERIRDQQDVAALALVRQADRLLHERAHPQRAAATYGRVLELFPQTPWAAVARQKLVEIKG